MTRPLVAAAALSLLACTSEKAKEATGAVVGKGVELGKSIGSGIVDGIEKGRKSTLSADGSRVLSTQEEVLAAVNVSVLEVAPAEPKGVSVTLAVANKTNDPLHLLGLQPPSGALLIDRDGFSTQLTSGQFGEAIVVPPSAKVKVVLVFDGDASKASRVRLWNKEFATPTK